MDRKSLTLLFAHAAAIATLAFSVSGVQASGSRGTALDNYCAARPAGTTVPQQSRPYRASGSSCALCHPAGGGNNSGNLNAAGLATRSGQSTTGYNPYCINTAPNGTPTISAPAAGSPVSAGSQVTFTGSGGTDPDGFALSYNWTFTNGVAPATGASVTVTAPATGGTLTGTLEVRDPNGAAVATRPTRSVTVSAAPPPNQAPNGTITPPASITQNVAATFQGSATDSDGDAVTYAWNFGADAIPATSTAQNPSVTFSTTGTRTVTLTVTDNRNPPLPDPTPASVQVTVAAPANQAPNGTITPPASVIQGVAATFQGSATDPNGDTVTYAWNFGANATPATSTAQNPSVTFSTTGTRTVTLTVSDTRNPPLPDLTPATVSVNVAAPPVTNEPPNGTITPPASITLGQAVTFQGSATDQNGDAVTYSWTFGANATPATSTAQNPSVTFSTAGIRTVTLTVTDTRGPLPDPTPASVQVTVAAQNQAPNGTVTPPASITQGLAATFQGSATDPDGDTVTYAWTFGANATPATSTAQNPSVTFNTTGTRTVTLTVTDARGLADSTPVSVQVNVVAPAPQPVARCADADGDGYSPDGGACGPRDCNDANAAVNPGAKEVCGDGIDNDCDGATDAADKECNGTDCVANLVAKPVVITAATWESGENELQVSGNQANAGAAVTVFNAQTEPDVPLGTTTATTAGAWEIETRVSPAPCRVRVEINGQSAERAVSGAPATCSGAANQAPNGTITPPASIIQGQAVTFQGSATDANGDAVTYSWNFGANATPATSTAQNPSVTFGSTGARTVTLVVTDSRGMADPTPASVQVTAAAANQAPNGTITPPAGIIQYRATTFRGSATDPNGDTVTYSWNFGANATPATSTAQNPSVTFSTTGTRTVTLTVKDSKGMVDPTPASVQVTVAANQAPNGTITPPPTVVQNQAVTFQGSATDGNGDTVTYAWSFGANATPASSTAQNPSVTFSTTGTRTVRLTVTDSGGLADPTPATVTVNVVAPSGTLTISRAEWDDELDVRGSGAPAGSTVTLRRTNSSGTVIGTTRASSTGTFRFERELSSIPCTVWVQAGTRTGARAVSGAGSNCVR